MKGRQLRRPSGHIAYRSRLRARLRRALPRPGASQTELTSRDQPGEFRPVLDALDEEDRRQPEEKVHDSKSGLPNAWEELKKLSDD
jgi:hypothetical protein